MKAVLDWKDGMHFEAISDGNLVQMDAKAPLGKSQAMTPKELVAVGLGGCTAMDVVALLKKHKQAYQKFSIEVDITTSTGQTPAVFTDANLIFQLSGAVDPAIYLEAVLLSQTKYCGVSKMLSLAFPIQYTVMLNNEVIGQGRAEF